MDYEEDEQLSRLVFRASVGTITGLLLVTLVGIWYFVGGGL